MSRISKLENSLLPPTANVYIKQTFRRIYVSLNTPKPALLISAIMPKKQTSYLVSICNDSNLIFGGLELRKLGYARYFTGLFGCLCGYEESLHVLPL